MTTEIVIMNRESVAMAADSAGTITDHKIFQSENKLFQLGKAHSIGIMIYQANEFMGVPWETIIKNFREDLADVEVAHDLVRSFHASPLHEGQEIEICSRTGTLSTVHEYALLLEHYVISNDLLNDNYKTPQYNQTKIREVLHYLKGEIINACFKDFNESGKSHLEIITDVLTELDRLTPTEEDFVKSNAFSDPDYNWDFVQSELERLRKDKVTMDVIDRMIVLIWEKLVEDEAVLEKLQELVLHFLLHDFPNLRSSVYSGVVLAGFGYNQVYPAISNARYLCKIGGKFRVHTRVQQDLKEDAKGGGPAACIAPYAQAESIWQFIEGYDQEVLYRYRTLHQSKLDMLRHKVQEFGLNESQLKELDDLADALHDSVEETFNTWIYQSLRSPLLNIIGLLPKDELADMARNLVNLQSFRRKVSEDAETVGGPIDVCLISKGDGLVWIKRKHYFDASINHQFLSRYLK